MVVTLFIGVGSYLAPKNERCEALARACVPTSHDCRLKRNAAEDIILAKGGNIQGPVSAGVLGVFNRYL